MKLLEAVSLAIAILAISSLAFIGGTAYSCEQSNGTFLPNLECVDRSNLDYCIMPSGGLGISRDVPRLNFTLVPVEGFE